MSEHNLPWVYHPREFDDWGWIRDSAGNLAACARGDDGRESHDQHRADGTDPYGEYAALIVKAVNNHDALVKHLHHLATVCCDEDALRLLDSLTDPVGGLGKP